MPAGVSAYVPLANLTLGANALSVTFSSISQSYRDLVLVVTGTTQSGPLAITLRLNADSTSANYSEVTMSGDGTAASSTTVASAVGVRSGFVWSNTYLSHAIFNIMDYSATDKHKTVLVRTNNDQVATSAIASRWANTAAVTSIVVQPSSGTNMLTGCTFALYGVSA